MTDRRHTPWMARLYAEECTARGLAATGGAIGDAAVAVVARTIDDVLDRVAMVESAAITGPEPARGRDRARLARRHVAAVLAAWVRYLDNLTGHQPPPCPMCLGPVGAARDPDTFVVAAPAPPRTCPRCTGPLASGQVQHMFCRPATTASAAATEGEPPR